ncbi:hypothetical protein ACLIYP_01140 [Streptomyces nanhaiensis]|uniref:hypothetical protein n=1 Tax=Streptomyces nanhaiensis TaxID=679319 RepID=UPI00399CB973
MSEETFSMLLSAGVVLALAALAVYLGGVAGLARTLPRLLLRDPGWRADTERHPRSSALVLAVLIVCWPVSGPYLAWRVARRRCRGPR